MKITVRSPTGETMTLKVKQSDTIEDIKIMIQDKKGIPPGKQHLRFGGIELRDGCRLSDYKILLSPSRDCFERVSRRRCYERGHPNIYNCRDGFCNNPNRRSMLEGDYFSSDDFDSDDFDSDDE